MTAHFSTQPYRNATAIGNSLLARIVDKETGDKDCSLLARVWIEVESFKREMRGIPRLSVHTMRELLAAKRANAKTIDATTSEPLELDQPPTDVPDRGIIKG